MMRFTAVGILLLVVTVQAVNNCADPPVIIPNTFLDSIFDTVFAANSFQK